MPPSAPEIERRIENLKNDLGRELSKNRTNMQTLLNAMGNLPDIIKELGEVPDLISSSLKKDHGDLIENFEKIRATYGDLSRLEADRTTAAGSALRRLETITNAMYMKQVEVDGVIMSTEDLFEKRLGAHTNFLLKNFTMEEATKALEGAQKNLNAQYARQINEMDSLTMVKIPAYTKGMGMSAEEVGEIMRISILRTGKASTEMLDNIAAYSQAISRKTGIPMRFLSKAIANITTDIRLYGDVTEEEAARIAGNITQLGMKFEDLQATQQKFGKFSGAADNIGKISQITGVQLDAQKVAFLSATGKMDEALLYMREQFKRQGFTKEDFVGMTLPLRNALSDAMIGGQEGVMNMLDMEKPIQDMADITAKTDISKGFKAVTDNLNQIAGYDEEISKSMEVMRMRGMIPFAKSAHLAANRVSQLKVNLKQLELPPALKAQGIKLQKKFLDDVTDTTGRANKLVKDEVKKQSTTYNKELAEMLKASDSQLGNFFERSGYLDFSSVGKDIDTGKMYARDPEEYLQRQGAHISDAIITANNDFFTNASTLIADAVTPYAELANVDYDSHYQNQANYMTEALVDENRIFKFDTLTLLQEAQTPTQLQQEKDEAIKNAMENAALTLKEGMGLSLEVKIVDTSGNVVSSEVVEAIKDSRNQYTGRVTGRGHFIETHMSNQPVVP